MSASESIGLLPGTGWIAGHNLVVTLAICWLLTPGGMFIVGFIGEGRFIPVNSERQFLSFFPGDFFLGIMTTGLLVLAQSLPGDARWYNATWWHVLVLVVAAVVAVAMTMLEWKSGIYPTRAIFSPTKLYHNGLLYVGYGYVIVTTLVAVVAGSNWASAGFWAVLALSLVPGVVWVYLVIQDNSLSSDALASKAEAAHVADWSPIWVMP